MIPRFCLLFLVYFFSFFFLGVVLWTQKYFGDVSVPQAISTVNFGMAGTFSADHHLLERFYNWCVFWPFVITTVIVCIQVMILDRKKIIFSIKVPVVMLLLSVIATLHQYHVIPFMISSLEPRVHFYDKMYRDLHAVHFKKNKPKSLVIIYVESLEDIYSHPAIFHEDLIKPLTQLKQQALTFKEYKEMPGADWTIAALVSTQCGIPLQSFLIVNGNNVGELMPHFLPNALCLSDVLHQLNYKNIFMGGADLNFSGKNKFLQDHHYSEIYGREEWLTRGYRLSELNAWGLNDDDLFMEAKKRIALLIKNNQLFNLTLLTVSTHGFEGVCDAHCRQGKGASFPHIVRASSEEVADFISYIKQQGWLNKLNVVVMGDHLVMKNTISDQIELVDRKDRTIFNMVLSQRSLHKNRELMIPFDWLPTLLTLSGIDYSGDHLALGYSGFADSPQQNVKERVKYINRYILRDKKSYEQFWITKKTEYKPKRQYS